MGKIDRRPRLEGTERSDPIASSPSDTPATRGDRRQDPAPLAPKPPQTLWRNRPASARPGSDDSLRSTCELRRTSRLRGDPRRRSSAAILGGDPRRRSSAAILGSDPRRFGHEDERHHSSDALRSARRLCGGRTPFGHDL
ncbi:MAG: hypothetical protein AAGF11_04330 [Myxococcota bacterium]